MSAASPQLRAGWQRWIVLCLLGWLPALAAELPVSGSWYDPQRAGEGLVIEVDAQGQAVLAWFSYDDAGRQRWFFGQGQLQDGRLRIDPLLWPQGSRFGSEFDPAQIQRQAVGWMQLDFLSCSELSVGYEVDGQAGQLQLVRLSRPVGVACEGLIDDPALALSGSWFDVRRSGEGLLLEVLDAQRAIIYWFGHDLDGGQLWMIGEGRVEGGQWVFGQLLQAVGGRFGPGFDPAQVSLLDWGSARLALDCAAGMWEYQGRLDGYGSGRHVLTRLHAVAGPSCRQELPERLPREQLLALTGATLLDLETDQSAVGQTLLVEQGQIVALGPTAITEVPIQATRIGLAGAFLIPGLTDLHTHIGTSPTELLGQQHPLRQRLIEEAAEGELLLYLSQGVTTVLNAGDFGEPLPRWRDRIDAGEWVGPKVYSARYLRGPPNTPDGGPPGAYATAATARDFVRSSALLGYDMIKIYNHTEAAALPLIFDEAATLGMAVLGHFPAGQSPLQTLDDGMAALAHGQAFYWAWGEAPALRSTASAALSRNGTQIIATLGHMQIIASLWGGNQAGLAAYEARPELRYLHPTSRDLNERSIHGPRFNPPGAVPGQLNAGLQVVASWLREFDRRGVPLLLGSDSPTVLGVPGFSAIEELQVMGQQLQLSNTELLRIGTHNGGDFINARVAGSEPFGRLAVGQRADLIVLSADPRADLANLHQRIGVLAQGRWYRQDWLDEQIEVLADRYEGRSYAAEAGPDRGAHGSGEGH